MLADLAVSDAASACTGPGRGGAGDQATEQVLRSSSCREALMGPETVARGSSSLDRAGGGSRDVRPERSVSEANESRCL